MNRILNLLSKSRTVLLEILSGKKVPIYVLSLFGILYITIVVCNHYFFRTWAWDYGSYNFAFYDYAHFRISDSPVLGAYTSFLQDHVSFTLMLFIPFYWALTWLTGTYTLSILQIIIILYGGWAVYKLIEFKTSDKLLAILALLQYLTLYGRWASFSTACNIAIFAASVVPVFLYYFEKKKFLAASSAFIFILLSREDMSLWTFFIGIFLIITHFKDKKYRIASFVFTVTSIGYFIFVFKVLIPLIETSYTKFSLFDYSTLGKDPSEALYFIITQPLNAIELLFTNNSGNSAYDFIKFEFYYVYFLFGGFLLFYRPVYLLLFIPLIAKKMFNDDPIRWSIESYYSIEFVTILPITTFLIIYEIRNILVRNIIILLICVSTFGITKFKLYEEDRVLNYDNTNIAFYKRSMYESSFDVNKVNEQLKLIPSDAKISTSGTIYPHLAFRPINYYFPRVEDAEYIAVFADRNTFPLDQGSFNNELNFYLHSSNWSVLINDWPLVILKKEKNKKTENDTNLAKFSNYICDAETLSPDGEYLESSNGTTFISSILQSNEIWHSGNHSIKLTKKSPYGMIVKIESVIAGDSFEISVWRYPQGSNSFIVANTSYGGKYYNAESNIERKEETGWELLKKTIAIPVIIHNQELSIYFWNNGSDPVYFDDLRITMKVPKAN